MVRILGPHPGDPGSSPGGGNVWSVAAIPCCYSGMCSCVCPCGCACPFSFSFACPCRYMCLCSCLCPWISLPAQQMLTNSARISVFGIPHPEAVTPGEIPRVFVFWLPLRRCLFSFEAVARINDARVFVFAHPQQNIAMTSVCVCACLCICHCVGASGLWLVSISIYQ